jgi:hypothetical protein
MERRKVLAFIALLSLLFAFLLSQPESRDMQSQTESVKPETPSTFAPIPNAVDLNWAGGLSLNPGEKLEVLRSVSQVPRDPQGPQTPQNPPGTPAPQPYIPGSVMGEKHRNQHAAAHVPTHKGRKGNVSKHNHGFRR